MLFALPSYQFPYIVMNRCLYLMLKNLPRHCFGTLRPQNLKPFEERVRGNWTISARDWELRIYIFLASCVILGSVSRGFVSRGMDLCPRVWECEVHRREAMAERQQEQEKEREGEEGERWRKEPSGMSPGGRPLEYRGSEGWASRIITRSLTAGNSFWA